MASGVLCMSKDLDLDRAIALFRSGESLRECEKKTGVNYRKIDREAKKRGVSKGDVSQLISSMASDKVSFVTLPATEQMLVTKKVNKLAAHKQIIHTMTETNLVGVGEKLKNHEELSMLDHKNAQDLIDKASVTLGVNQRHANGANIQQNNQTVVTEGMGLVGLLKEAKRIRAEKVIKGE